MANLQIRRGISYQADYLDIKDLGKTNKDILTDLDNIQELTNMKDSSHISIRLEGVGKMTMGNDREFHLKELLFSLIGVPLDLFLINHIVKGLKTEIDTSLLLEDVRNKLKQQIIRGNPQHIALHYYDESYENRRRESMPRPNKKEEKDDGPIIGVVFLHTLLYKSEIPILLNYYTRVLPEINTKSLKLVADYTNDTLLFNKVNVVENGYLTDPYNRKIKVVNKEDVQKFKEEDFEIKSFTLMIPVYSRMDFIQPSIDIYNKRTFFKEHSILNWYLPYQYNRYSRTTIDMFGSKDTINNISINFTYFPSEVSKTYYNKYVGEMTTTLAKSFTKSPILQSCFSSIQGKNLKKLYEELTGFFQLILLPENLINTMRLNQYAGTFYRGIEDVNGIDLRSISKDVTSSEYLFVFRFLGNTPIHNPLIDYLNDGSETMVDSFKKVMEVLAVEISKVDEICKQYNIDSIIPTTIKESLLYYAYYFFVVNVIESDNHDRSSMEFSIYNLVGGKEFAKKVCISRYERQFSTSLKGWIVKSMKMHSTEEIIDICFKAKKLYYQFMVDSFITFLTLNESFKEIVESYRIEKSTDYIEKKCQSTPYTYKEYRQIFFAGGFNNMQLISIRKNHQNFANKQIGLKFGKSERKRKKPPEYYLYHLILKKYKSGLFRSYMLNTLERMNIYGWFNTKEYLDILESKLTFGEHIKKITTLLETKFDFSR